MPLVGILSLTMDLNASIYHSCTKKFGHIYTLLSKTGTARFSEGPLFRKSVVPNDRCSEGPLFRRSVVPKVHCSEGSLLRN